MLKLLSVLEGKTINSLVQSALDDYLKAKGDVFKDFMSNDGKSVPMILVALAPGLFRGPLFACACAVLVMPIGSSAFNVLTPSEAIQRSKVLYSAPSSSMRRLASTPGFVPQVSFNNQFRPI